mmetsp:Transcript_24349/g.42613  ORF Transcript_24349/g.42613 Transcript_24349/m.42613 type:complete len:140 (+) Transcript_24349:557-976(+)
MRPASASASALSSFFFCFFASLPLFDGEDGEAGAVGEVGEVGVGGRICKVGEVGEVGVGGHICEVGEAGSGKVVDEVDETCLSGVDGRSVPAVGLRSNAVPEVGRLGFVAFDPDPEIWHAAGTMGSLLYCSREAGRAKR